MPNRKKLTKELISSICKLIEEDKHTVAEICSLSGISKRSFYKWQAENAQFTVAISRARENANQIIVKEAKNSLRKLLEGFEVVETETKTRNLKNGKKRTTTIIKETHVPPDMKTIIRVLTNKEPEVFKNRHTTEITGKNGKDLIPARVLSKIELKDISSPSKVTPNRSKPTT